ncbi:MAG: diphosphomevalonate decarboxylase [Chloroflexi bacterium]|nr:diphosphomevalonate decarboxylase [Chloroflexota bacterium]
MQTPRKASARAGSNIAFLKYWGNRDDSLNLPNNSSLSLTLDALQTVTSVEFSPNLPADEVIIDGQEASPAAYSRVTAHLDFLRSLAKTDFFARVGSRNNFPLGVGLAASASGFAALTVAATKALGLEIEKRRLTRLARRGSGSAARSILGGYVEWLAGSGDEDSYAREIFPKEHWELLDIIAIVSTSAKEISSQDGHRLAATSPFYPMRLQSLPQNLSKMKEAIERQDLETLGPLIENEALSMHSIMMTSKPPLLYWQPATLAVLREIPEWRKGGIEGYFTLDAGPNVHVLTLPQQANEIRSRLEKLPGVQQVLVAQPGEGAKIVAEHLF